MDTADPSTDWSLLQAAMERLAAADSPTAMLQALLHTAPALDAGEACLWTAAPDERWTPCAALPPTNQAPRVRHDHPAVQAALAAPGVPALHSSPDDTTLALALALHGRLVGLLTITWPGPVALGPRERRIYQALAHQAAPLLDRRGMIDRLQASLTETQRQQRLLETVIDHVPVGILCIEANTRRPLLTNRTARLQLAGSPEPVSTPLPIAHMLLPGTDTPIAESELAGMRAIRTGEVQRVDLDLQPVGGQRFSVETLGAPVRGPDGAVDRAVVVMTDITERRQAAEERARLQEEVIRAQAAALVERSTPLIPITDDVLVMPLIGTIDRERGQSVLEIALQGAHERRARVTILDVTGVPSLDAAAVAVITGAAHALRLLGVAVVLSGVRPQVARSLVDLDVSLAGIVTRGTLQAAIEFALQHLGKRKI